MNEQELFREFEGREERLRAIPRFSLYPVMYYRSNLLSHVRHVSWIVRELSPTVQQAFPSFDPNRAEVLALVHDDAELVTGDVQAGNKLKMSKPELSALKEFEAVAIERLAREYPGQAGDFSYPELLLDALNAETFEAKVVKYLDKFDAFGEALHEIFAGNSFFVTPVRNEYGRIATPLESFRSYIGAVVTESSELRPLMAIEHPFFSEIPPIHERAIVKRSQPHTRASFESESGYAPYDAWKHIILKCADPDEIALLTTKRESYRVEPVRGPLDE